MENLAEKVDKCPLNRLLSIVLGLRKLSVIQSSGVYTVQGLLKY